MIWIIKPFVGLGPISFSMTPEKVAALAELGPVTARDTVEGGYVNEFRGIDIPNLTYLDATLIAIGASRRVKDVVWNNIDVFASKPIDVLQALERANNGASQRFGSVVFEKFGLQLSGFYMFERSEAYDPASDEQDDRGLAVVDRAAQDRNLREMAQHISRVTFF